MTGRSKVFVTLAFVVALIGALLWFRGELRDLWMGRQGIPSEEAPGHLSSPSTAPAATSEQPDGVDTGSHVSPDVAPGPDSMESLTGDLPPSPPLPDIAPEATQPERRRAFHLEKSVDHIVRRDEPFEAVGGIRTIEEMERALGKPPELGPVLATIEERDIGEMVRRPILETRSGPRSGEAYYGVRVVRSGENLWDIHYGIIREYFERREVTLPVYADRPMPDGRSSGVGRLLKFMETIVRVYDVQGRRPEGNLDLIHPEHSLVYFRISELFDALDQLKAEDLRWLRYVRHQILLESPAEQRELLERGRFFDR
ncbi:MAG: hypothetical protein MUC41_14380 [Syntrophobacteraceae bacterium]|nr:hypothetical protein [Syntrophobacteraceae bacterium]